MAFKKKIPLFHRHYQGKVLDFHWMDYDRDGNWGKVYLNERNGGRNQKWKRSGSSLYCTHLRLNRNLYLDVHFNETCNYARVGANNYNGGEAQSWTIESV